MSDRFEERASEFFSVPMIGMPIVIADQIHQQKQKVRGVADLAALLREVDRDATERAAKVCDEITKEENDYGKRPKIEPGPLSMPKIHPSWAWRCAQRIRKAAQP